MDQWFAGSMDRWFDGSMVRWFDGLVVQWFAGSMVWWIAGSMVPRWLFSEDLRQFESADHKFWRQSLDFVPFFRILSFLFVIAFVYCFVLVLILESSFCFCTRKFSWLFLHILHRRLCVTEDFGPLSRWVSGRIKALENGYIPLTKKAQWNAKFWKKCGVKIT